jgi:hypothetical protein
MKIIKTTLSVGILAAAALVPAMASAADACTGTAGNGTQVDGVTDGTAFVRVTFTPKCSANVLLQYSQTATSIAVASASKKGKNAFKGNSAGGSVATSAACASSSGCVAGDVDTALVAAVALAGST